MRIVIAISFFIANLLNAATVSDADCCAFCNLKVIDKQSVFESEYFTVLLDYAPRMKGHLLAVPKRHVVKVHELFQEEWADLFNIIPNVVKVFSEFLATDEYIMIEKNGPRALQNVPHVHFHLLPVTNQKWAEIFDIVPRQLSQEEIKAEQKLFRSYFSLVEIL